jgi:type I restriction enzyme S subunit
MKHWKSGSIDELCEVEYGTRVTRKRDGGTKYPVYGGGGATFFLDDFNREDQMIVSRFAMSEECVRFVSGKFFLNDSGLTVRTRDASKISQDFVDQQLLAKSSEIYSTARGTAQKNMDMMMFRNMELAYPDSLEEQKRIVALLDAATARVTELTECYDKARTHANNLFASALQSELEGGSDWPVKSLDEICDQVNGSVAPRPGQVYQVFSVPSFDNLEPEILNGAEIKSSKRPVSPGDVLLCKINPRINRVWRVAECSEHQQIASTEWFALRPRSNMFDVFLVYFLQSPLARRTIVESVTGATGSHTRANYEIVKNLECSVPPLEEQKRIVARLDAVRAKTSEMVSAYDAKLQAAKDLRQSILEAAFRGEL